ncbi:hypothetical protein NDU88_006502 [Pleurodeles waltl]|uniref:Uncharacterized protein n=1 Tax=Pleurodeles waltl TaxID=8319 RepID=A0AAV7MZN8_PLEWA|nr:hypothetical protein NDU88_006502 [Pleurodeles waltl]
MRLGREAGRAARRKAGDCPELRRVSPRASRSSGARRTPCPPYSPGHPQRLPLAWGRSKRCLRCAPRVRLGAKERVRPPESPSAAARVFTARPTGARVSVHSAGVPGASPSTRDGRRASQLPSGARPESRSRPLLDSRASFNLDGGDLLASRDILHFSRAPAQMHSGAQVARSPPPHRRHVSPHIGPQGSRVPDRRAGVSGILHRAVAPAGEPPTSGSAERRGPGRHFEFIEPAAAGAITAQICRGWFQGGSLGSRSRWAPPGRRQ